MTTLQLRLLGPPRLARDGAELPPVSGKGLALLALLSARREPVARDQVLGLLWPDSTQDAARKNLRNTLWAIGRALGDGAVLTRDDRLWLSDAVWVDVRALVDAAAESGTLSRAPAEALAALAELYRGPLLAGLNLAGAPELELWLAAEREQLAARYLSVLAAWAEVLRRSGDWAGMADVARRALAVDQLHEPMQRVLIEALARAGQRAEALRAFEGFSALLAADLGVAPLADTIALAESIRAGDLGPPLPGPALRQPAAVARPGAEPVPFVGRAADRAVLDQVAAESIGGAGSPDARVVLLTGEAGIGKTRLWRVWSEALPPAAVVIETRGLESTRTLPFVPLADMLARAPALAPALGRSTPLADVWLADLARLRPELRLARPGLPAPPDLPAEEERRRLFEALVQALAAIGGRPLALFVDDAHWADEATLDWLGYLVHRWRDGSLLVVVAYRPEDAPPTLRGLVAGWERAGVASRLSLARLDDRESAALLDAMGTEPARVPALLRRADGNPLFLTELARADGEAVPSAVGEAIRVRLTRLPAAAQQVLQAAAVLEPDIDFLTLRRTAGRGEDETLDALDALLAAAVLTEQGDGYAFAHPLVGQVVRADLGSARRTVLHRRAAEALAAVHMADPAAVAGRLAEHHAAAGEPARAAESAALAAARAMALAAPGEAVALYERALAWDATPARHLDLADARVRLGDAVGARADYGTARDGFKAAGDGHRAATASFGLAGTYLGTGQPERIVAWAEDGLALLDGADDPAAHALAQVLLGAGRQHEGAPTAVAEAHLRTAARLATEHDLPRVLASSQFELGNLRARQGDLAAARAAYREVIGLAQAAGDGLLEALGHNNTAYHALLAGDLADARAHLAAGLALAEAPDLRPARQWLLSTAGELALAEGQWDEAEGWLRRALAEAEHHGNPEQVANGRANLAWVERGRGRLRQAAVLLDAAAAAAARLQAPYLQTEIDLRMAQVALERGEAEVAAAALDRARARLAERPFPGLARRANDLAARLPAGPRPSAADPSAADGM